MRRTAMRQQSITNKTPSLTTVLIRIPINVPASERGTMARTRVKSIMPTFFLLFMIKVHMAESRMTNFESGTASWAVRLRTDIRIATKTPPPPAPPACITMPLMWIRAHASQRYGEEISGESQVSMEGLTCMQMHAQKVSSMLVSRSDFKQSL